MSLWKSLIHGTPKKSKDSRRRRPGNRRLTLESLEAREVFSAAPLDGGFTELAGDRQDVDFQAQTAAEISTVLQSPRSESTDSVDPVLMVISNQDFWFQDYADTRVALAAQGLDVVVAATTTEVARPQANSGQGADGGWVRPDLALTDVEAEDYSAIVFSGGWGMAQYQYGFEGTYHTSAINAEGPAQKLANELVNEFLKQDEHVAAVCHGVSVLAYARVDGASLGDGTSATGWYGAAPAVDGAALNASDDVFIDGRIITAENYDAASALGEAVASKVVASYGEQSQPKPVLMVIANQDFYHREYFETRESLEAAGLEVVVAAATTQTATPHAISVVEGREPNVTPGLALADANADDYSAIIFVGGYGAASYQYASETTYDSPAITDPIPSKVR